MVRLSLCVLAVLLVCAAADDLHDLSSNDEPALDAAMPLSAKTELGEDSTFKAAQKEHFGFGGIMTSGSFMMMSSGYEEEELGEGEYAGAIHTSLDAASSRLKSGTDGNETRCSSVLEGVPPGDIDCNPWNPVGAITNNRGCTTDAGWSEALSDCQKYFGDPPKCPDGIGPNGVYITGHFGTEDSGYCVAWDSPAAARGYMDCTPDYSTCTSIAVKKGHMMSPSAGVFMLKRIKCTSDGCKVFKLGKCFDVSPEKPFKNCKGGFQSTSDGCIYTDGNSYEATKLEQDTQAFAKLVLDQMRADASPGQVPEICEDACTPTGGHGSSACTQEYCDKYKPNGEYHHRCDPGHTMHNYALEECKATCGLCLKECTGKDNSIAQSLIKSS